MSASLKRAMIHATEWLAGLNNRAVGSKVDTEMIRKRMDIGFPESGMAPEQVIDELVAMTEGGHLGSASGRFFAWVIGGSTEAALAADWLTSTWDQNAALVACGPAAAVAEQVAGQWIKELLDLPRDASFAFTTGCQLAHFTALAAARHSILKRVGWNVAEHGLFGAPPIRVLTSEHRHGSIDRAVRYLGLGSRSIVPIETNSSGQMSLTALKAALEESSLSRVQSPRPTIVVLNAADLNVGAFDSFRELIPVAKQADAWVHVDGAFGLFARVSRKYRHLIDGVELADSWATDAHKWLNVPFDCGIAMVRDVEAHHAAMTLSASYIDASNGFRDQIDWNPEWSRRARGIPVYAALREFGRTGVEDMIDRCCAHCHALVTGIGELQKAMVISEPLLNQGLVRFYRDRPDDNARENDAFTDETIAKINATGEAFFSGTTWQGQRAMRISVVNWRTTEADVTRTIAAVSKVLGKTVDDEA